MTPEQIHIVHSTWLKMLPRQYTTPQLFYRRLFEVDPSLRHLFRSDMQVQGQKLMQVIDTAVNGLSRLEHVVPMIQALGRRHAAYGVTDEHYGTVGAVLLWTLGKSLGSEFTTEVKAAWAAAYGMLATTMREAARQAAAGEPLPTEPQPVTAGARPESQAPVAAMRMTGHTGALTAVFLSALAGAAGLGIAATADLGKVLTATIARSNPLPSATETHCDRPVTLTVFREGQEYRARVKPGPLRMTLATGTTAWVRAGAVALPQQGDPDQPVMLSASCTDGKRPCL